MAAERREMTCSAGLRFEEVYKAAILFRMR